MRRPFKWFLFFAALALCPCNADKSKNKDKDNKQTWIAELIAGTVLFPIINKALMWYIPKAKEFHQPTRRTEMKIRRILKKAGLPNARVFVEEKEESSNAYAFGVNWLWGGCGIAVTRGLLESHSPEEIDAIVAHECGHHKRQHPFFSLTGIREYLVGKTIDQVWARDDEFEADMFAAKLLSPAKMVRALVSLDKGRFNFWDTVFIELRLKPLMSTCMLIIGTALLVDLTHSSEAWMIGGVTWLYALNTYHNKARASTVLEWLEKETLATLEDATHPSLERRVEALLRYDYQQRFAFFVPVQRKLF